MHSNHPANRMLRLVLEIAGLIAVAQWGWQQPGVLRFVFVIGAPLLLAAAWMFLGAPSDPIPNPRQLVSISGGMRLSLEFVSCVLVIWAMFATGQGMLGLVFAFAILLHYMWAADRALLLMRR